MPLEQEHPSNIMTAYDLFTRRFDSAVDSRNFTIEVIVVVLCLSITTGVVIHYAFEDTGTDHIPGLIISIIILIITTLVLLFYKRRFGVLNNSIVVKNLHKVIPQNPPLNTSLGISNMWDNFMGYIFEIQQLKGEHLSSLAPLSKGKHFNYSVEIDGNNTTIEKSDYDFTFYDPKNNQILKEKKFSGIFYYSKKKKKKASPMIEFHIFFIVYSDNKTKDVYCNTNVIATIKNPFNPLSTALTQDFVLIMRNSINNLESAVV